MKRTMFFIAALLLMASCASQQESVLNADGSRKIHFSKEENLPAVLRFEIPSDIVASRTVVLKDMSVLGLTREFEGGLQMDRNRIVEMETKPFIVPEGGISIVFHTVDNQELVSVLLSGQDDAGMEIRQGETYDFYVPSADNSVPVSFPVVFPLGENPDSRLGYYCNHDEQPEWYSQGIWRCFAQKQAYAKWVSVSRPSPAWQFKRVILGKANLPLEGGSRQTTIGSVGIASPWVGDYFEFTLPVERLEAGTELSFSAPFYGRNFPVFWTLDWFEEGEWVNDAQPISVSGPAVEGGTATSMASFALKLYGNEVMYSFTLGKAVEKELKLRLRCSDNWLVIWDRAGQSAESARVVKRDASAEYVSSAQYYGSLSNFYFTCPDSELDALVFDIIK